MKIEVIEAHLMRGWTFEDISEKLFAGSNEAMGLWLKDKGYEYQFKDDSYISAEGDHVLKETDGQEALSEPNDPFISTYLEEEIQKLCSSFEGLAKEHRKLLQVQEQMKEDNRRFLEVNEELISMMKAMDQSNFV